jgi:hypothetical protein
MSGASGPSGGYGSALASAAGQAMAGGGSGMGGGGWSFGGAVFGAVGGVLKTVGSVATRAGTGIRAGGVIAMVTGLRGGDRMVAQGTGLMNLGNALRIAGSAVSGIAGVLKFASGVRSGNPVDKTLGAIGIGAGIAGIAIGGPAVAIIGTGVFVLNVANMLGFIH